jgi:hypothetical protein
MDISGRTLLTAGKVGQKQITKLLVPDWCQMLNNQMVNIIWVNYNDLTATSLESWLIREIIPKRPQDSG